MEFLQIRRHVEYAPDHSEEQSHFASVFDHFATRESGDWALLEPRIWWGICGGTAVFVGCGPREDWRPSNPCALPGEAAETARRHACGFEKRAAEVLHHGETATLRDVRQCKPGLEQQPL